MFALVFKWISVFIMYAVVIAFYLGWLPPYHTFTNIDTCLWIFGLGLLATLQMVLLIHKVHCCYICRVWSDFILQLTGLAFISLSGIFGVKYPPFSWAMGVFPIIGVLYLVVGRLFSQRSRECLREQNGTIETYQH